MLDLTELINTIKESKQRTSSYDTEAVVRRIEGNTAWVHIPGGVDETPVRMTIKAAAGDTVQVRVSGGSAFLVGNATAPPTDDKKAVKVEQNLTKDVDVVRTIANKAAKIAGNTNQYFWFTKSGTDTGAHITEVPQDEFIADPSNGGGNLLARSNGIAVRDGTTELATFGADGVQVGRADKENIKVGSSKIKFNAVDGSEAARIIFEEVNAPDLHEKKYGVRLTGGEGASYVIIAPTLASGTWDNNLAYTAKMKEFIFKIAGVGDVRFYESGNVSLPGNLTIAGNLTINGSTSWTTPQIYSSAVTFPASGAGGYYTEGKRVYVQLRCVLAAQLNADTARQLFSGMPVPKDVEEVALCINVRSRHGASCFVDSNGALKIVADPDHAISANQNITITGVYTIS